jgi:hypothetical protein
MIGLIEKRAVRERGLSMTRHLRAPVAAGDVFKLLTFRLKGE